MIDYRVARHKKGWSVERHEKGAIIQKTVVAIVPTKAMAKHLADHPELLD